MSTEVTVYEPRAVAVVPDSVINEYLESMGNNLAPTHRNQFVQICRAFNLNPFIREVYGIPYKDKFSIIVGYEVYLKRAETSGQLAGWKAWTEGTFRLDTIKKKVPKKDGGTWEKEVKVPIGDLRGCVEIIRKDWSQPFYHEVFLDEYTQDNEMWGDKPRTMIKKVAIAQAFRLAFPVELGGIPYTADELPALTGPGPEPPLLTGKPEVKPPQAKTTPPEKIIDATPEPAPATTTNGNGAKATEDQIDKLTVMLAEYCDGDELAMAALLKARSEFKDRNGNEKFLTLKDLNTSASGKWVGGTIGNLEKFIKENPKQDDDGDWPL